MIKIDELKNKIQELNEESDYYKQKVDKLEVENNQIRQGKGENKKVKELENEVEYLKMQLDEASKNGGQPSQSSMMAGKNMDLRNIKKSLSPEE